MTKKRLPEEGENGKSVMWLISKKRMKKTKKSWKVLRKISQTIVYEEKREFRKRFRSDCR